MAATLVAAVGTAPQPCTLYLAPACSRSASAGWRGPWESWAGAAEWWSGPWWCRRAAARGQSSGCPSEGLQRQSRATSNLIGPTTGNNTKPLQPTGKNKTDVHKNSNQMGPRFRGKVAFYQLLLGGKKREKDWARQLSFGLLGILWKRQSPLVKARRALEFSGFYLVWNQAKDLFSSFNLQYELKAGRCNFRHRVSKSNHSTPGTSWKHRTPVLFYCYCFQWTQVKGLGMRKAATCLGTRPERRCSRSRRARSWPLSPPPSRRGV